MPVQAHTAALRDAAILKQRLAAALRASRLGGAAAAAPIWSEADTAFAPPAAARYGAATSTADRAGPAVDFSAPPHDSAAAAARGSIRFAAGLLPPPPAADEAADSN